MNEIKWTKLCTFFSVNNSRLRINGQEMDQYYRPCIAFRISLPLVSQITVTHTEEGNI